MVEVGELRVDTIPRIEPRTGGIEYEWRTTRETTTCLAPVALSLHLSAVSDMNFDHGAFCPRKVMVAAT